MKTMCGCGTHLIDVSEELALYQKKWWTLRCLSIKVDKRLPRIIEKMERLERQVKSGSKMRLKFIRMKKFLTQMPCTSCNYSVGNRFVHKGEKIYCGKCWFNRRKQ